MKAKKFRLTYREHSQEAIDEAIRQAIPEGGVFADYLTETCLDLVYGETEFERGIKEGQRRFAGWLLHISRTEPEIKHSPADYNVLNAEGD